MAKRILVIALTMFLSGLFSVKAAFSSCQPHPMSGIWYAKNYNKYSPKKVEIIHNCEASISRGKTQAEWMIRVYNHCRPKDCIWGRAAAIRDATGIFRVKFETFSATRTVTIVPKGYRLEVKYTIDYRSERRGDLEGWVFLSR